VATKKPGAGLSILNFPRDLTMGEKKRSWSFPLAMPIEEAMRTQRSIRRFKPDPVDDDLLLHVIELATRPQPVVDASTPSSSSCGTGTSKRSWRD
jgi:hypothetical protein